MNKETTPACLVFERALSVDLVPYSKPGPGHNS